MRYTIYKTTNRLNGKFYIGKHQTENPNDNYLGSGKALLAAIKLYGRENFQKEILFDFDNELDMNSKERELITEEFVKSENTYNLGIGGEGGPHFKGRTHSEATRKKVSKSLTGKSNKGTFDWKENSGNFKSGNMIWKNRKNYKHSEETKQKIRDGMAKRKAGIT